MRAQHDGHGDDGGKVRDGPASRGPCGQVNHASGEDNDEHISGQHSISMRKGY